LPANLQLCGPPQFYLDLDLIFNAQFLVHMERTIDPCPPCCNLIFKAAALGKTKALNLLQASLGKIKALITESDVN
jgi:hypothetical protein